ncbi:DUF4396 domain-containing protein [Streptomyces sp. NPDC059740]|uniref:DUF4396 domain-containing protein n=1 Tax=Streptomyces sp. NPDC059740 TaxID=3346926 RepID=UPI00365648B1
MPEHDGTDRDGTGHAGSGSGSWGTAARATLHCLTGCALGEIVGMVVGTAMAWNNVGTVGLSVVLAFVFGYALTVLSVRSAGLGLAAAGKVALAADTVSIAVMELVDNGVIGLIPGALEATLSQVLFWWTLALSLLLAFLVTTPVNRMLIRRGRGHAVAHRYH